ncbi:MAG: sodium:solute symporter family protein [Planctomycetota bacterium]
MKIHPVDIVIIVAYLCTVVTAGVWLSKRASRNLSSYFLGGKTLPWYLLGISNASGMFDITGTMLLVYWLFVYGLKSAFIPWVWPTFNQIFLMVYLAIWIRRSKVLTGAEWIRTRFGHGSGSELSHISVVIFALVTVIGFLSYAFQGIGKFAVVFFPWDLSPEVYAILFMSITTVYVILGGMYSVVLTDLIQYIILTSVSIFIGYIALSRVSSEQIASAVPEGWSSIYCVWRLDLNWSGLIEAVNTKISGDGYSLFGIFLMMVIFKGFLASMAGPTPGYDMQRVLATKDSKSAALMSGFVSLVLFFPRYLMVTGITVLALVFFSSRLNAMGPDVDFEQILPYVIGNFIPVGLVGFMLAGLLAAFMSTFDSTVNSGAAYIVNDIYKRYINPNASDKKYVRISYVCSILIVIVGIAFGFMTESINTVLTWIAAGLYGGYIAPNVLRWHWWRLNGYGYFAGMMAGIISALVLPILVSNLTALESFPINLALSTIASVAASLITQPESDETLKGFYKQVRPWGFWKPIHLKVIAENPDFVTKANFKRDSVNVIVGIIWQLMFTTIPIYLVIKDFKPMLICIVILVVTSVFLKYNWYDKLEKD